MLSKKKISKAFLDTNSKAYFYTSDFLAFVTVLSIMSLILETVKSLADYSYIFNFIEWFAVVVFSSEYIMRIWITKPATKYIFSFFGIIDLVSVLPSILGLGNWVFLKSARAIRIVRLLRMMRLAKLSRVRNKDADQEMGVFISNILIYTTVLLIALITMGTAIYLSEPTNPTFANIPAGMWWAFKVFMGGMTVTVPETGVGDMVFAFSRFVGLLLFGLMVGIVGNIFRQVVLLQK